MKLLHIVGNRPQFIKLSVLQGALERRMGPGGSLIVHTGQHYNDNMSAVFFSEFGIPSPDFQLNINNLPHNEMIGSMLIGLDGILASSRPDAVIVYGDTNSTLAGALAARKRNIPLVHVEAGIRTGNESMPEESNRYLTDRMADLNFCCTYLGVSNLAAEGITTDGGGKGALGGKGSFGGRGVFNTGDVMLDGAMLFGARALSESRLVAELFPDGADFILATIHRFENVSDPLVLRSIISALELIGDEMPVVFPAHPNTSRLLESLGVLSPKIRLLPPLGYLDMLALLQSSRYVITDSGGLARESFFFQKPALVVMESAFWPEIFQHGPSLLARADRDSILERFGRLLVSEKHFEKGIFGDGHAADMMSQYIVERFGGAGI